MIHMYGKKVKQDKFFYAEKCVTNPEKVRVKFYLESFYGTQKWTPSVRERFIVFTRTELYYANTLRSNPVLRFEHTVFVMMSARHGRKTKYVPPNC